MRIILCEELRALAVNPVQRSGHIYEVCRVEV
jgi:hypothetical protein